MVGIKDFEMPKKCIWDCPLCNEEGGACQLSDVKTSGVKRPSDCPLVEAIPKADYEARLKADMVAMLTELQLEIEEKVHSYHSRYCPACEAIDRKSVSNLIEQKINALKADREET